MSEGPHITFETLEELASSNPKELLPYAYLWLAGMARSRVAVLLHEMFEQLDDHLFELTEQARSDSDKDRLSEGLREVRSKRPDIVACFRMQLSRDFGSVREQGKILPPNDADPDDPNAEPRELQPCSPAAMEAFEQMATRARTSFFRALNELNQHLGDLQKGPPASLQDNPLSPTNLCRCFQYGINLLQVDEDTELMICHKFDRYVLAQLQFVLDHVNGELRKLAKLKDMVVGEEPKQLSQLFATVKSLLASKRTAQQADRVTGEMEAIDDPETAVESTIEEAPNPPAEESEVDETEFDLDFATEAQAQSEEAQADTDEFEFDLDSPPEPAIDLDYEPDPELVTENAGLPPIDEDEPALELVFGSDIVTEEELERLPPLPELEEGQSHIVQTVDILAVLTDMQRGAADLEANPEADEPDWLAGGVPVSQEMMSRLAERRPEYAEADFTEEDEGTIDLVDLVFDFVLHDHNLPGPLQGMLASLQVPYLRVALLDWQLFALADHPARKLLDELARAAQGWSADTDIDDEIYQRIELVTQSIMGDFSGDQRAFSHLLDGFSRFMHHFENRASAAEDRAVAALRERERLGALKLAAEAIRSRMGAGRAPDLVDELLRRVMPEVLVANALDHGVDSAAWNDTLALIEDLVASTRQRENYEEVEQLQELVPGLFQRLGERLELLLYPPEKKEFVFEQLQKIYRGLVIPEMADDLEFFPEPEEAIIAPDSEPEQTDEDAIDFEEAVELILGIDPATEDVSAESLHEALAGSWFEFNRAGEDPLRAKLSWTMPVGSKYLFVDQNGQEVAEMTLSELATEIRAGRAVLLESIPLFERALGAIADRLLSESKTG